MKIAICSDLHIEMGDIVLKNTEQAKVLILAGDICVARDLSYRDGFTGCLGGYRSQRIYDFFNMCCDEFEHVIYIMGNHEHYHSDFNDTLHTFRTALKHNTNLHILNNENVVIDNYTFIGTTLWSDMNNLDAKTIRLMPKYMNDFRIIGNGLQGKFTPQNAIEEFDKAVSYINSITDNNVVVIGHHSPSHRSISAEFADDHIMNGGFHSNLEQFIIDRPNIKLWVHGHTHSNHDYVIGGTRIVCNPRGYINYEAIADDFKLKYINI
jgi:predicted phosphodiesterase